MANIEDSLIEMNPWWKGEFNLEFKEREIYTKIKKFLKLPQIIALVGLRRVGKTTLMLKIVKDKIKLIDPKRIIYFSFDEFKEVELRDIIKNYEKLMEKDCKKGKYLFLFDEIQKLNNWENQIKTIYDNYKNIKIVISGSESLFLQKKSKETLAGRIFEFKIESLSFKEFLKFKDIELKPINLYKKELKKLFDEFTLTLGFPELVGIKDKDIIKKYIKESIIEKVLYRDMIKLFKIRDISVIESLLNILTEQPGQIIDISDLASDLNISRQTLSNYLYYFEKSFLVRKLYNFSNSRRKVERKLKRYYPTIISPSLLFKKDDLSKSKVFETLLVNQLKPDFFWRDSYKNEVDIILEKDVIKPIEVKYGKLNFKGIQSFMKKFKCKKGYIVSYDKEIKKGNTQVIPAYKFLLN